MLVDIILMCQTGGMADKKISLGPTGEAVAANVARIREAQNLSYAELSRRLRDFGRPIAVLGLTRIEKSERRVDADDLAALALALGVAPITLLMPNAADWNSSVEVTGHREPLTAIQLWRWLAGYRALDDDGSEAAEMKFALAALPTWEGARKRDARKITKDMLIKLQARRDALGSEPSAKEQLELLNEHLRFMAHALISEL